MKTVVIFATHVYNAEIERQVKKLRDEIGELATLYLVYQQDAAHVDVPEHIRSFPFTLEELNRLGYHSWGCTLMDGNFHFVPLYFYLNNPDYDWYWLIEYDVRFSGDWGTFFSFFEDKKEDFISAHIEDTDENPDWPRWEELELANLPMSKVRLLKSFNPICRFSNRALALLHERCRLGDRGHNELLMPTLFNYYRLRIADFGGNGKFIYVGQPDLFYADNPGCPDEDKCTHRYRPAYKEEDMLVPNMIYHPIK